MPTSGRMLNYTLQRMAKFKVDDLFNCHNDDRKNDIMPWIDQENAWPVVKKRWIPCHEHKNKWENDCLTRWLIRRMWRTPMRFNCTLIDSNECRRYPNWSHVSTLNTWHWFPLTLNARHSDSSGYPRATACLVVNEYQFEWTDWKASIQDNETEKQVLKTMNKPDPTDHLHDKIKYGLKRMLIPVLMHDSTNTAQWTETVHVTRNTTEWSHDTCKTWTRKIILTHDCGWHIKMNDG